MQTSGHADMTMAKRGIFQKNSEINPFVFKSELETNCERFSKGAIRENFNPKSEPPIKTAHSN